MQTSRRGFLNALGAAVAGLVTQEFDPERLLWVPGAKTIFLPPPPKVYAQSGWIAGDGLTVGDIITISGAYAVNPLTGKQTEYMQQFVITDVVKEQMRVFPYSERIPYRPKIRPIHTGKYHPVKVDWSKDKSW